MGKQRRNALTALPNRMSQSLNGVVRSSDQDCDSFSAVIRVAEKIVLTIAPMNMKSMTYITWVKSSSRLFESAEDR